MTGGGPGTIFVMVADDLNREEAEITVWHEFVHIFRKAGGHPSVITDQSEAEVEAIAKKLAKCCPEILELCGIADKFK